MEEWKAGREREPGEIGSETCLSYSFIFNKSLLEHAVQVSKASQSIPVLVGVAFLRCKSGWGASHWPGSPRGAGSESDSNSLSSTLEEPGPLQCMLVLLSQILSLLCLQTCKDSPSHSALRAKASQRFQGLCTGAPPPCPSLSHLGSLPWRRGLCIGLDCSSGRYPCGPPQPQSLSFFKS